MALSLTSRPAEKTKSWIALIALMIFLPLLILGVSQISVLISRAAPTPANIVLDSQQQLGQLNFDFIHAFAQGGEESTNQLQSIQTEIRKLNPKLIRIDHIFDHYEVVSIKNNSLEFNWNKLDATVDTIRASGAIPLLVLSYMPVGISTDHTLIGTPSNWNDWSFIVQKTIEHYSGKNQKNIPGAYYEVWNEPDLPIFGSWKTSGTKNYLTLYDYSQRGAQQAQNVNHFYIGGPVTTGLYKNWIESFIQTSFRIDFISWHSYLKDPTKFKSDQVNIREWIKINPSRIGTPILITEFGFTGDKDPGYSTMYGAIHTAAVVRQLLDDPPKYLVSFQLKDGPNQESGNGWGLITHETNGKRIKPRFGVYSWLDQLTGARLQVSGEGSYVTAIASKRGDSILLLLINFNPYKSYTEAVPINITNLPNGTYFVREKFYQGLESTQTVTALKNSIFRQVLMPSYSMVLIEVTKI